MKGNITNVFFRDTKSPQRRWLLIGVITICIIVVLCLLLRQCDMQAPETGADLASTQPTEAMGSVLPTISFGSDDGYREISDSPSVILGATSGYVMQSHSLRQDIEFSNNAKNPCALKAAIYLADGTLLYESRCLMPGETVANITLTTELNEGLYQNALLLYTMYSLEKPHKTINQCEFPIEIQTK